MKSTTARVAALVISIAVLVGAFVALRPGGDDAGRDAPTPPSGQRLPQATRAPTGPSSDPAPVPRAERTATIRVRDGGPVGGVADIEVTRGEMVAISLRSDAPGEVHIHGVDEYVELDPHEPVVATFEAPAEGIFEIEHHDSGELLARLEVRAR